MNNTDIIAKKWRGKHLDVNILFSHAGIAQQIVIENENGWILIDAGDGTLRDLRDNKIDRKKLAGILFTHGHFDHMGGLHTLLGFLRMIGRMEDLPIILPVDCAEIIATVDNFTDFYGDSVPFRIPLYEAGDQETFEIAGMAIDSFETVHCGSIEGGNVLDRIPSLGYLISYNDETVAISGDTGDCPKLRELVDGVDLAIIEATYATSADVTKEELEKVHLSEDLASEIGALAKEHLLVHKGRR